MAFILSYRIVMTILAVFLFWKVYQADRARNRQHRFAWTAMLLAELTAVANMGASPSPEVVVMGVTLAVGLFCGLNAAAADREKKAWIWLALWAVSQLLGLGVLQAVGR